jgi:hypothetical protein
MDNMNSKEIVKQVLKEKKMTQTQLAAIMGYTAPAGVTSRLCASSKDMSCALFAKMLDSLGYEVVVQPKTQGKRKEGSMVLEQSECPDEKGERRAKSQQKTET